MKKINYNNLNGWAISEEAIAWIVSNVKDNSFILEFGSGKGTIELAKYFNVISVDTDKKWVGLTDNVKYVLTTLQYGWFDMGKVRDAIFNKSIRLVIVDAPQGTGNRNGFIEFAKEFKDSTILIDDTNRKEEAYLANEVSKIVGRKNIRILGHEKSFDVI